MPNFLAALLVKEVFPAALLVFLLTFLEIYFTLFLAESLCLAIVFEAVCLVWPACLLALPARSLIGAVRLLIVSLVVRPIRKINHHVICQDGGLGLVSNEQDASR